MLPRKTIEFKSKVLPTGYNGFEESRKYIRMNCDEIELKFHPSMLIFMYNLMVVDGQLRMSHGATNHNVPDGQKLVKFVTTSLANQSTIISQRLEQGQKMSTIIFGASCITVQ